MSLTSFLKNRDVEERFLSEFPKPRFELAGELLAPPRSKRYSLVGTAFDYLIRFHLKHKHPRAVECRWIAYGALRFLGMESDEREFVEIDREGRFDPAPTEYVPKSGYKKVFHKAENILAEAQARYSHFLHSGQLNDALIKSSIQLAQLDLIFRSRYVDGTLGRVYKEDIEDLKQLMAVMNLTLLEARRTCILNPGFGASGFVGGADADIVIDNALIEIKTTMHLRLNRRHFNQLIGYYVLSRIGGISSFPSRQKIHELGIYYARHGKLYTFPVETVVDEKRWPSFIRWFKKRAAERLRKGIHFNYK